MEDRASILTSVVRQAAEVVAAAEVPEALHKAAFERVLDLLLADAGVFPDVGRPSDPGAPPSYDESTPPGPPAGRHPLPRIARRAGIAEAAVRDVYRLENDQISLVVGDKKLDRNKATGSRQITLLVAGGRQAAEFEEWTNLTHAREVCAIYNRLDSKNYAATIKSMADVFNFHGQGVQREVRLTMPGWNEWAHLVRRLGAAVDDGPGGRGDP